MMMKLTPQILSACMPQASRAACEVWAPAFDAASKEFGIADDVDSLAAWLASMANESGQLTRFEELSYFSTPIERIQAVYGWQAPDAATLAQWKALGRRGFDVAFFDHLYGTVLGAMLGNAPNEGHKFRGLGPGQITGKNNCRAITPVIGVDLVANPEAMRDDPGTGARAFAAYFGPINHIADIAAAGTENSFLRAMRAMNSGLREDMFHEHHLVRWHEVRAGLGLDASGNPTAPPSAAPDEKLRAVQAALLAAGYDPKGVDGIMGKNTRAALRALADRG